VVEVGVIYGVVYFVDMIVDNAGVVVVVVVVVVASVLRDGGQDGVVARMRDVEVEKSLRQ